jgi:NADH:ubiquinone oxidoreductase subunit E
MLVANKMNIKLYLKDVNKLTIDKNLLLSLLKISHNMFGFIPNDVQEIIENKTNLSHSYIVGVSSFYEMFQMIPTGKYQIGVCSGINCDDFHHYRLLEKLEQELGIKKGHTTDDKQFTIIPQQCIGNCASAPNVTVNSKIYEKATKEDIKNIVNEYKAK